MLSLAACSGSGTAAGSSAAGSAASSASEVEVYMSDTKAADIKLADTKNLVEVTSYELQSMDYVTTAMTEDHTYNADLVDGLLENDQKGNLVPCLAESYEVSEDGLKWTFHLKKGIKWVTSTGEEYDEDALFEPEISVYYGAYFLDMLLEEFGNTETALAAYHAGRGKVNQWLSDPRISPDGETLENIPYEDTAGYVKRVMKNTEKYKNIYDIK
jgi:hypothetical protein